MLTLAVLVGLLTGCGEYLFHEGIRELGILFFEDGKKVLHFLGPFYVVILPVIGGLLVGVIAHFAYSHDHPHGVAGIMEAVALRGGRLPARELVCRVIGSVLTIGTGGSAGPEDPSVQIGAAVGTTIGQGLKLSDERIRGLVASGAAAGIGAAFNAPIAGVFFALEIILGEVTGAAVGTIIVAAVVSALLTHVLAGPQPAFMVPPYSLVSYWELTFYLAFGVLAGFVSVLYIRSIKWFGEFFANLKIKSILKPALGGLIVGLTGFFTPEIFGVGYHAIETILKSHHLLAWSLFLLVATKMFATSVTLGSGGQGGMFAPALFLGAMLGGGFGVIIHALFPTLTATPQAYILVGMAAVLAGAVRAPITAVLLLFEMTQDYRIILPLMFSVVISTLLSEHWHRHSVYSQALDKFGINLERGHDLNVMQGVLVGEAMATDVKTVSKDLNLAELQRVFITYHHHGFPVVDEKGELWGIVSIQDLEKEMQKGNLENKKVADIATRSVIVTYPDEPVWVALRKMGTRDVGRLPVVDRKNPKRIVGIIARNDIIHSYQRAILRRQEVQRRAERWRLGHLTGMECIELKVSPESQVAGKLIKDIKWPPNSLLISIRQDHSQKLPHGNDLLNPGDVVIALVDSDNADKLRTLFQPA
ncbi:MAG: chloride channel protein, partial [Deltaproteobacteria bacterium]